MNNPTHHRSWILGICRRAEGAALALAIVLVPAVVATAQSYTFDVLYSFTGAPYTLTNPGPVVQDAQGNLYGTTGGGGAYGAGTVFKLDTSGNETVLYSFTGTGGDGSGPTGVVLDAQGNLYGTTNGGGAFGAGTVFKVDTSGNETVLYSFAGSPDGASPVAGVVLDAQGNLYGTTNGGGAYGAGTVFKVDTTGAETVLYSFHGASGTYPLGGVVLDAQGNLYGTTIGGGAYGLGTVFKVDTTGAETVLYSFTHGTDGQQPHAGVVLDAQGNLYGTTYFGGYLECPADAPLGCGTVFKLDTTGQFTVLHAFGGRGDGFFPLGDLALDVQGNLYGTCFEGPADNGGMVFALYTSGTYTVLHIFTRTKSGIAPGGWDLETGVTLGAQGNLYGTTHIGGGDFQGTLFALLTPAAATTTTLTSAPNPSVYERPVTFTAMVSGGAGAPPNGETVTFMNLKTVLGTGTLSGGSASFTTSTLNNGTTAVTALYGGDALFAGSTSNAVKQVVTRAATTTTLSSSLNPSSCGQAVTFTAVITSVVGAPPDGETVSFMKGTTVLGTGSLSGGSASFTTSALPAGTNVIRAVYAGDASFVGSSSKAVKQAVDKYPTTTALSSSLNPSNYGQAVTFTAVVTSSSGAPPDGDTITFKEGTTVLGTGSLSGGSASFTTSALPVGTNAIKAVYGGDIQFAASTSNVVKQVVN